MGGQSSKEENLRQDSSLRSSSSASASSWNSYPDPHLGYGRGGYPYSYDAQQPSYQPYYDTRPPPPPQNYDHEPHTSGRVPRQDDKRKLERKYSRIADNYNSIDEECIHLTEKVCITSGMVQIPMNKQYPLLEKTLVVFVEDNLIPCFGFGDASTHDQDVFSFYPDERFCNGFEEILSRYREIVPNIRLAGPTSFAPVVEMAMAIVEQSGGQYHVLVIIADGQVTRSIDTDQARLSPQEQKTVDAIVEASEFPFSIMLVGVGDGPWDMMKEFDDNHVKKHSSFTKRGGFCSRSIDGNSFSV
ncbi:unnamed protein product [Vicia faba]|uniref:Copine C-terminal domain-containing protein n=1 Tax=Vicia faba TaxID=3906 RepID=A0AAV0ZBC4_VICFA|nr:unnamed protein product [Vicia faba]